jgi:WD40 repeat protein
VLTGTEGGQALLWDPATGQQRFEQPLNHQEPIRAVALSADGRTAATASTDDKVRLWDVATGKKRLTLKWRPAPPLTSEWFSGAHSHRVNSVAFSQDGKYILTGSDDRTARLWDAATGQPIEPASEHLHGVLAVAFSPFEGLLATASRDRTARLWTRTPMQQSGDSLTHPGDVTAVAFSPTEGRTIATASTDNAARVWEIRAGKQWSVTAAIRPRGSLLQHSTKIGSIAFSSNGQSVLTSGGNSARLWEASAPGLLSLRLPSFFSPFAAMALSRDGRTVLAGISGCPRLWRADTGQPIELKGVNNVDLLTNRPQVQNFIGNRWRSPSVHVGSIQAVALSPDGGTILTAGTDGTARLWKRDAEPIILEPKHEGAVLAVAIDERSIVTGGWDGKVQLWDVRTRRPRLEQPLLHGRQVHAVALSPNGRVLLTGGADGIAQLWDADTGKPLCLPLRHQGPVRSVAFSRDSTAMLTGSEDGTARLWDVPTGRPRLGQSLQHDGRVLVVALSADGRVALTGSEDCTARLWDVGTGKPLCPPLKHLGAVRCVDFSPDSHTVLTGSDDRTAQLWDTTSGKPLGPPLEHKDKVTAVAFSPLGGEVWTASWDRFIRRWTVPAAVAGETERLALWVQVLTGMELDANYAVHSLDASTWQERRQLLGEPEGLLLPRAGR